MDERNTENDSRAIYVNQTDLGLELLEILLPLSPENYRKVQIYTVVEIVSVLVLERNSVVLYKISWW